MYKCYSNLFYLHIFTSKSWIYLRVYGIGINCSSISTARDSVSVWLKTTVFMFIKQALLTALLKGIKQKEGRLGKKGDYFSRLTVGKDLFFQTWTLLVWWTITSIDKFSCPSDALRTHGYKAYIPDACSLNDALRVYYMCVPKHKKYTSVTNSDIWAWDHNIRCDPNYTFYSFGGTARETRIPVNPLPSHSHNYTLYVWIKVTAKVY